MQLTYRGNSYETLDRINSHSNFTDRLPIKLIYRGQAYYYYPRSVETSGNLEADQTNVTLIYRGTTYERQIQTFKPDRISSTFNWNWQFK
jgi:hypothetical protein